MKILVPALLISIVGYVESISVALTLAAKRRQRVDPDQELIALGASNIGAAVSGGFPVTGGFARSVVNFEAGAKTPAAGAFTVVAHAAGYSLILRSFIKSRAKPPVQTWPIAWLIIRLAWFLVLINSAEITIWALFYLWRGCLPDSESGFCFSGVTYTTVGYGDLVLPKTWRILAPVRP
jgi:hypothetical protein